MKVAWTKELVVKVNKDDIKNGVPDATRLPAGQATNRKLPKGFRWL
jgi:hypothetical protein